MQKVYKNLFVISDFANDFKHGGVKSEGRSQNEQSFQEEQEVLEEEC